MEFNLNHAVPGHAPLKIFKNLSNINNKVTKYQGCHYYRKKNEKNPVGVGDN